MAVSQVTTWWVAPDSTVTERTFRNTIESIGTATSTQTLVSAETIIVRPEVFSTDGYRSLGGYERPESPTGGPESTVRTAASPFDVSPLTLPTDDTGPTPTLVSSGECLGDDLDLASEPPLWRQSGYGTWYRVGCLVRVDVITDRPGPDHCGWGNTRVLVFGSPIGAPFTAPDNDVQYVRDPTNEYGYGFDAMFDSHDTLPADAVDSGYSTDNEQLWTVPSDDTFIYLVLGDRTERWPKGDPPLCD